MELVDTDTGEGVWNEWRNINIRTLSGIGQRAGERSCAAQGAQAGAPCQRREGLEEGRGRRGMYKCADLHCCMAETNTVL